MRWQIEHRGGVRRAVSRREQAGALDITDVEALAATWDVRDIATASARPRLGAPVIWLRKFLRTALFPVLLRMSDFNAATLRAIENLSGAVGELTERIDVLERASTALAADTEAIEAEAGELRRRLAEQLVDSGKGLWLVVGDADETPATFRLAGANVVVAAAGEPLESAILKPPDLSLAGIVLVRLLSRVGDADTAHLLREALMKLAPEGVLLVEELKPGFAPAVPTATAHAAHTPAAMAAAFAAAGLTHCTMHVSVPNEYVYLVSGRRQPIP
jgi:hypothetical protein